MWNHDKIIPMGEVSIEIENPKNSEKSVVSFIIVREDLQPLLGFKTIENLNLVSYNYDRFVHQIDVPLNNITDSYPSVFDNGLGTLPGKVRLRIKDNANPEVLPARRVPFALRDPLRAA